MSVVFTGCYVSVVITILQMTQMKLKDSRIKMMNEVLNGIKVCDNVMISLSPLIMFFQ